MHHGMHDAPAELMVRISRTFHNNRSLRVSAMYARGPRLRMSGRPVRAAVHTVLDGAHSRRIRTGLSLQLRVMYWLSFTAVRVVEDGAPDCARSAHAECAIVHTILFGARAGLGWPVLTMCFGYEVYRSGLYTCTEGVIPPVQLYGWSGTVCTCVRME